MGLVYSVHRNETEPFPLAYYHDPIGSATQSVCFV
jgi:hypothetical protein